MRCQVPLVFLAPTRPTTLGTTIAALTSSIPKTHVSLCPLRLLHEPAHEQELHPHGERDAAGRTPHRGPAGDRGRSERVPPALPGGKRGAGPAPRRHHGDGQAARGEGLPRAPGPRPAGGAGLCGRPARPTAPGARPGARVLQPPQRQHLRRDGGQRGPRERAAGRRAVQPARLGRRKRRSLPRLGRGGGCWFLDRRGCVRRGGVVMFLGGLGADIGHDLARDCGCGHNCICPFLET